MATLEELREAMISTVESLQLEMGTSYGTLEKDKKEAVDKVAKFETAIIQTERKRILDAFITQFPMGDGTYMMIRTSVLEPEKVVDADSKG